MLLALFCTFSLFTSDSYVRLGLLALRPSASMASMASPCDRFLLFESFTVLSRMLKINLGNLGPWLLVALLSLLLRSAEAVEGDLTEFGGCDIIGGFGSFNFNLSAFSDFTLASRSDDGGGV